MLTGVGVFSALAGAMSSLFLAPTVSNENRELERLSVEVASLRDMLKCWSQEKHKAEEESFSRAGDDATPAARTSANT
jgi:gas vesicle protein